MLEFIKQLSDSLETDSKIKFGDHHLKVIEDFGIQTIKEFTVRLLNIRFLEKEYKIGFHFYKRHNGPCLALCMFDKENKFGNSIQYKEHINGKTIVEQ